MRTEINVVTGEVTEHPDAPVEIIPETTEQTIKRLDAAIVRHLNQVASLSGWDSIYTAMARAGFDGPFKADGLKHAQWADACFAKAIEIQNAVEAGSRTIPTEAELIAELPDFATFV